MNASMPVPFHDDFVRREPSLGEPIGDYDEHILRCAVMNQAMEGYDCTEFEIAAARQVIQQSVSQRVRGWLGVYRSWPRPVMREYTRAKRP